MCRLTYNFINTISYVHVEFVVCIAYPQTYALTEPNWIYQPKPTSSQTYELTWKPTMSRILFRMCGLTSLCNLRTHSNIQIDLPELTLLTQNYSNIQIDLTELTLLTQNYKFTDTIS